MKAAAIAINEEHYRKVANAKDIDRRTYNTRQHQDYLKPEERRECVSPPAVVVERDKLERVAWGRRHRLAICTNSTTDKYYSCSTES
jgi:hypothetical protein